MRPILPSWRKIWEWMKRYVPQELVALTFALCAGNLLRPLFLKGDFVMGKIVAAYIVTFADAIGYGGYAVVREWIRHRQENHFSNGHCLALSLRDVVLEYTVASVVDTIATRPFFMYWCPRLLGDLNAGIVLGQVLAGATFYLMVIPAYEWRKKKFRH